MDFLLGIDLGTTGLKTTLLDTSGKIVATEYTEYPILSPQIGYAEQNPEVWWTGLVACCRSLQANYPDLEINVKHQCIFWGSASVDRCTPRSIWTAE